MPTVSHPHLHGRSFGSALLSVSDFNVWLRRSNLHFPVPCLNDGDFFQIETLLVKVELDAGSISDEEAAAVVAADQFLAADAMASLNPRWLVGAEAHRKWRVRITDAVVAGELVMLDFGSKLPLSTSAMEAPLESRDSAQSALEVSRANQHSFGSASLRELLKPCLDLTYENLPSEVQDEVAKQFTPSAWNASSRDGRSNWAQRHDDRRGAECAELAEVMLKHEYWFKLQVQIAGITHRINMLDSAREVVGLRDELVSLQGRWHKPEFAIGSPQQMELEKNRGGAKPTIVEMREAVEFLAQNTGVAWTEAQLLAIAVQCHIDLCAAVPPWTSMYIARHWDGLPSLPYIKPGCSILAAITHKAVEGIWVTGRAYAEWVAEESFDGAGTNLFFTNPVLVGRSDVRLTMAQLLRILKAWEDIQRAPMRAQMPIPTKYEGGPNPAHANVAKSATYGAEEIKQAWILKAPKRYQGYGKPLHDVLKAAHIAGRPRPSARDVLDAFKQLQPPEVIEVMADGMKYYDGDGNSKAADLGAIRKAIDRLAQLIPDSPD